MTWDPTGPATSTDLDTFLSENAINPELARAHGVTLANAVDDLPESLRRGVDLPAIVWPWRSPTGGVAWQALPPRSTVDAGRPKYKFAADHLNVLNEIRAGYRTGAVYLVEGTKQAYAVASALPDEHGVYGMAGCYGWRSKKGPILDLDVTEGRDVYVLLDADAADNADVYTAGERLAETLADTFLAASVKFVKLPGSAKQGADDVLAGFPADRRREMMARWTKAAKDKPAPKKPAARKRSDDAIDLESVDRPVVKVNGDRKVVVEELTDVLLKQADRKTLFSVDGKMMIRRGAELELADKGGLLDLISENALTGRQTDNGLIEGWPDDNTVLVLQKKGHRFSPLTGVVASPFVREDGTVCTENGYDEATRQYVALSPDVDGITVPDRPTDEDVAEARRLIFDELFVDFPLEDQTARANALGLLLTPFIRSQVDLAPLAVVNAHSPGTGKTLFAGLVAYVATGNEVRSGMLNSPDEEVRKTMFSALLAGEKVLLYDEAHDVRSKQLVEKLTSSTVTDRPLGRTEMISVRQQVTWMAAGNNVLVQADLARRHYRINMFWHGQGEPGSRPVTMYRHQDIRGWVRKHRRELVRACLVLIRSWYASGRPEAPDVPGFGSFEQWTGKLSGILHHVGVPGFLGNLEDARSENDTDTEIWAQHVREMHFAIGEEWKTSKELVQMLRTNRDMTRPPVPWLKSDDDDAPRVLGNAYAQKIGRDLYGIKIERAAKRHYQRGTLFRLVADSDEGGNGGSQVLSPSDGPDIPDTPLPFRVDDINTLEGESAFISPTGGGEGVSGVPGVSGSERPGALTDALDWEPDPKHTGVWTARLADNWARPRREAAPRNSRFDDVMSALPTASHGTCRKHPGAPGYHPRGGHLATCGECFPNDQKDNGFRP